MQKNGEVLKSVITFILWVMVVTAIAFAVYVYVLPEPVQLADKEYTAIDTSYYNVDDNELDGEWLQVENYTVDTEDLNKYEDLKDLYKGRDNPFGSMEGIREEIITPIDPLPPEEPEEVIID